jgi:DNA-binding transcriptional regulator YiaG
MARNEYDAKDRAQQERDRIEEAELRDPPPNNIGARIRARRIELELSQEKLGELSGYLQCQVSGWERGADEPRLETIEKLARALDCSPSWLTYGPPSEAMLRGRK